MKRYRLHMTQEFLRMTTGERHRAKPVREYSPEDVDRGMVDAHDGLILYDAQEDLAFHPGGVAREGGWYDSHGQKVD